MGELLNMDVVNVPTYDGFQASSTALLMAGRITGRSEVLICGTISQDKLSKINDYSCPHLKAVSLKYSTRFWIDGFI
jgi:glycine dehydrogenase subunit 1